MSHQTGRGKRSDGVTIAARRAPHEPGCRLLAERRQELLVPCRRLCWTRFRGEGVGSRCRCSAGSDRGFEVPAGGDLGAAATGTPTRTTFSTGSVTLPVLAEHVKALIDDLTALGINA